MSQAVSQTSYYTVANIIRHMTSLVMLPIYTRYLTPEDYGIIELMSMALDLTGILVCNRIGEAIYRYYFQADSEVDKARTISTAFSLGILINAVGFLILLAASGSISSFISPDPEFHPLFVLFSITLIFEAIINIPIIYLRIQNLAKYYLLVSIVRLSIQVSLNIYFVVIQDMHVAGVVYSALIANCIMGIILGTYFIKKNGVHFHASTAYKIMVFSIPMIVVASASFATTFGDRYFLKLYTTLTEVGIYSLAYKFGFIFMALSWDPFFKYWEGQRYKVYKMSEAQQEFRKSFVYLSLWLVALGTLISIFLSDALVILADEKFHSAADYAPYIILAYIFFAWGHYCDFGIFLREKTKYMAYTEVISAFVIVLLYMALIPRMDVLGAALATLIGYFFRFVLLTAVSFTLYRMKLPWLRMGTLLIICFSFASLVQFRDLSLYYSIPIKLGLTSMFGLALYFSPLVKGEERREVNSTVLSLLKKAHLHNATR